MCIRDRADRVLPEGQLPDRVAAGGEQGVRPGGGVRGQLVQREGVRAAGGRRVGRGLFGVRGRGQRRRQGREGAWREGVTGPHAGERLRFFVLGGTRRAGGAQPGQRVEQVPFTAAAQQEQDEGVGVQQPGGLVAEGGGMLAGVTPVGAAALRFQVAGARQQGHAAVREGVGHLLVEERRDVPGPVDGGVQEPLPVGVVERAQPHLHTVRARAAALYVRQHQSGRHGDGVDIPLPRISAPALQPLGVQRALLQCRDPRVPPPTLGEPLAVGLPGREGREGTAEFAVAAGGGHGAGLPGGRVRGCRVSGGCGRGGPGVGGLGAGSRRLGGRRTVRRVGTVVRRATVARFVGVLGCRIRLVRRRRHPEGVAQQLQYVSRSPADGVLAHPRLRPRLLVRRALPGGPAPAPDPFAGGLFPCPPRLVPSRAQCLTRDIPCARTLLLGGTAGSIVRGALRYVGGRAPVLVLARPGGHIGRSRPRPTAAAVALGASTVVPAVATVARRATRHPGHRVIGVLGRPRVTREARLVPIGLATLGHRPAQGLAGRVSRAGGLLVGGGRGRGRCRTGSGCRVRVPGRLLAGRPQGTAGLVGPAVGHDVLRRETRSDSSRSVSSVRADSPEPRMASARARLAWSISAIRSSTVPSVMRRWTWTGWVWPMR